MHFPHSERYRRQLIKVENLPKKIQKGGNEILGYSDILLKLQIECDKPGFHSERYIWPVGYCSTRLYPSMLDPDRKIQYFCYIKDGGADPTVSVSVLIF